MDKQTLYVLKIIFGSLSILFGVLVAWFEFWERWQTEEERVKTRRNYGNKWRVIRDSGFLELPEKVIKWFIKIKNEVVELGESWLVEPKKPLRKIRKIVHLIFPALGFAGVWYQFGLFAALVAVLPIIFYEGPTLLSSNYHHKIRKHRLLDLLHGLINILYIFVGITFLIIILKLPIICSTFVILVLLVLYPELFALRLFILSMLIIKKQKKLESFGPQISLFAFAITFSLLVTFSSLTIGHFIKPDAWVPQTLQMLFSNAFFDGITLFTTFLILGMAVAPNRRLPVPIAIFFDTVVAALLACGSLYFGLIGTERALSLKEVLFVLIGKSTNGTHYEFGPYFLAMHTTFLPTLLYLSIILLCWVGKLLVLPVAKILMKGEVVEKPHRLTAGALLFLAVFFGGLWRGIGFIQEYRMKQENLEPKQNKELYLSNLPVSEKPTEE